MNQMIDGNFLKNLMRNYIGKIVDSNELMYLFDVHYRDIHLQCCVNSDNNKN